jgi:hypothetical protein
MPISGAIRVTLAATDQVCGLSGAFSHLWMDTWSPNSTAAPAHRDALGGKMQDEPGGNSRWCLMTRKCRFDLASTAR